MCGVIQHGVIHIWQCSIDRHGCSPCERGGDGKRGLDDGPYGEFQRNDVSICKALLEFYHVG